jgi:GntR family transcriptional regulator
MSETPTPSATAPAPRPLYVQVRELMIGRMIEGVWKPGAVLPSEMQLAAEFGVSQGTVRKALDALAAEKLVIRRQGRGTFVAEHDADRALFHFFHLVGENGSHQLPGATLLSCRPGKANRDEAARLEIARGAPVIRIRRTRDLGGVPAIFELIAVPADRFPTLGDGGTLPNTLYALYESKYGVTIVRAEERLRAVEAPAEAADSLGLAPGAPLLEIDRVAFALDGRPAEWRLSLCDTRHHHYLAELV